MYVAVSRGDDEDGELIISPKGRLSGDTGGVWDWREEACDACFDGVHLSPSILTGCTMELSSSPQETGTSVPPVADLSQSDSAISAA